MAATRVKVEGTEVAKQHSGTDESAAVVIFVRLRSGVAGERARVVHLADFPGGVDESGETLKTLCRKRIQRGEAELLTGFRGMPCERCLARQARREAQRVLVNG